MEVDNCYTLISGQLRPIKCNYMNVEKALLQWLLSDDTGLSSEAICSYMLGFSDKYFMPPSDGGDRGRCIRLLKIMPEWYERLDEMNIYPDWVKQIKLIKKEYARLQI